VIEMAYTVSQVAKLSGVSVRALHHYDEIGLLRPARRSDSGYRLYSQADLQRLQQVLFFRSLELSLEEIARIMADPEFDVLTALRMQRQMLAEKAVRMSALIDAVDNAIETLEKGTTMGDEAMFEVFKEVGRDQLEAWNKEAEQRWGEGDAWKESKRRTAGYTKEDWEKIKAESGAIFQRLAALLEAGKAPTDVEAMDAAEEHRLSIDRWYYPCPKSMHRGLGELYVNDARFTANIDKIRPGLSLFCREAFRANSER
jgi:DNA-binding transcriptional MerR regulator